MALKFNIKTLVSTYNQQLDVICREVFETIVKPFCHKHSVDITVDMKTVLYQKQGKYASDYNYVVDFEERLFRLFEEIPGFENIFDIISHVFWIASNHQSIQYDPEQGFL